MKFLFTAFLFIGLLTGAPIFADDSEADSPAPTDPCAMERSLVEEWINFKYLIGTNGHRAYQSSFATWKNCVKTNLTHPYYCNGDEVCIATAERNLDNYYDKAFKGNRL